MPTPDVGRASIRQELPENPAIPALGSIRWHGRTKPRSSSRTPGAPGNRWKRPPSAGTSRARPPGARCGLRQRVLQPDARRTRGRGDRGRTGREPDFVRAGEGGREDFLGAVRVRRRASGVRGVARDLVEYEIAGRDASDIGRFPRISTKWPRSAAGCGRLPSRGWIPRWRTGSRVTCGCRTS